MTDVGYWDLHLHSCFSRGDALYWPHDMMEYAVEELGRPAMALTDHGTMNGNLYMFTAVHDFRKEFLGGKIEPVLGCEFYIVGDVDDVESRKNRSHITVVAKNWEGYQAMVKLCRYAYVHHNRKPIIDRKILKEMAEGGETKHLVATSGCPVGDVNKALQFVSDDAAEEQLLEFKSYFPSYYVELMDHRIQAHEYGDEARFGDEGRNLKLWDLAQATNTPVVVTNDVHYTKKEDAYLHHGFIACMGGASMADRDGYSGTGYWMRSDAEMEEAFDYMPEAYQEGLESLGRIYDEVKGFSSPTFFTKESGTKWHLPNPYEGQDSDALLTDLSLEGLKRRAAAGHIIAERKDEYLERLKDEISVVCEAGFASYFLIIEEFVKWCKNEAPCRRCADFGTPCASCGLPHEDEIHHESRKEGYHEYLGWQKENHPEDHPYFGIRVGPGRGSAGGSLLAYCLGVTDIDPLRYGLLFERFLDPVKLKFEVPDVDLDFQDRDAVIEHVRRLYGEHNVAKIPTWSNLQEKSSLKRACTALGISFHESNQITKMVDMAWEHAKPSADTTFDRCDWLFSQESAEHLPSHLKKYFQEFPELETLTRGFHRRFAGVGTHPAGIVITTPGLLEKMDPTTRSGEDGEIISGFQYFEHKNVGLVKMDILGLRNLDTIEQARYLIYKRHGVDIEDEFQKFHDKFDDPKVYDMLSKGATAGVFQFEGAGLTRVSREIQPQDFSDLVDITAISRPGASQFINIYRDAKFSGRRLDYPHPEIESAVSSSYGIILFDEQVLHIGKAVAGMDIHGLIKLKRAIKYYDGELMATLGPEFIQGCIENGGLTEEQATEWWHKVERFSGYGFNRAHAVAYTVISYWTAWLKCNYPTEYMAALLSTDGAWYVPECRLLGIEILPPDVQKSGARFDVEDDFKIRYGLTSVKGLKDKAFMEISKGRPWRDMDHFWEWYNSGKANGGPDKRRLNSKAVNNLRNVGAFECIGGEPDEDIDLAQAEIEIIGNWVRNDPLADYRPYLDSYVSRDVNLAKLNGHEGEEDAWVGGVIERIHHHKQRNGRYMAFITVKLNEQQWDVVLFASLFEPVADRVEAGRVILAKGAWQSDRESLKASEVYVQEDLGTRLKLNGKA